MSAQLLMVDDEPGLREAVKDYLQESGFTVQVASNAREGWELMQQNTPDLVISDIMMPQVDGYQFLKQVREDRFRPCQWCFNQRHDIQTAFKVIKLC